MAVEDEFRGTEACRHGASTGHLRGGGILLENVGNTANLLHAGVFWAL